MDSSITIPAGIPAQKPDENCNPGTAVGAVFDKLSRYLKVNLSDEYEVNSDIVAFSIRNSFNSTPLPEPVQVV